MTREPSDTEKMSRAARPTLFDASRDPELIMALVVANLMSPALWAYRDTLQARIDDSEPHQAADRLDATMQEIQSYANRHLFHVHAVDMAAIWGLVDLDEERWRLGSDTVDYALGVILDNFRKRQASGTFTKDRDLFPMVADGKFPEYEYSNIDIIRAHRRNLKQKKHKPIGITACVDEAALIAALACALRGVSFEELVVFGSPVHYTTFVDHGGQAYWFNGKQEYFNRKGWQDLLRSDPAATAQDAFDARMEFDRIITPRGYCLFDTGASTLPSETARMLFDEINGFFDTDLRQVTDAADGIADGSPPTEFTSLAELDSAQSAEDVRAVVLSLAARYPGSVFESALYTFRLLCVANPVAYLHAAVRGPKVRQAAGELKSVDDAIARIADIADDTSIFGERERIALPDEVLQFDAASDRERALLLYTMAGLIGEEDDREILFTTDSSFVRAGSRIVDCRTMKNVRTVDQPVDLRLKA